MEVTKSITKIRKEKGYSQIKIAEVLQTTQQQYSKYEQGKQEIPVRHIITLCEFYKVTANKLLGIETYMSEKESNNKFYKYHDEIIDLIEWAMYQEIISDEQGISLVQNINEIKAKLENE